jgi:hypothetical protein
MTHPRSILAATAVALAASLATSPALADDWRQAHVRSVGPRPDADAGVDLACAPALPGDGAAKVLVASVRTGKSHYWRAFNIAADDSYATGDEIIIDVAHCRVARLPNPAEPPASAP